MAKQHWEDREKMIASIGSNGLMAHIFWFAGFVFVILAIIADAANVTLGLTSAGWFLLAIAAFLASLFPTAGWVVAWYLITTGAKKKE